MNKLIARIGTRVVDHSYFSGSSSIRRSKTPNTSSILRALILTSMSVWSASVSHGLVLRHSLRILPASSLVKEVSVSTTRKWARQRWWRACGGSAWRRRQYRRWRCRWFWGEKGGVFLGVQNARLFCEEEEEVLMKDNLNDNEGKWGGDKEGRGYGSGKWRRVAQFGKRIHG